MKQTIEFRKLADDAKAPHRAHPTDSGADLFALENTVLPPGETTKIRTGIALALPEGTSGLVWGKSSLESQGLKVMAGLIDAPYRGEIIVCLHNLGKTPFEFKKGQKIAQLVVLPTLYPDFCETGCLSETKRGEGGFGSTGTR
ncbi:MAG: dUTP diphosphatase [Elusimicrobiaceae bacterium]